MTDSFDERCIAGHDCDINGWLRIDPKDGQTGTHFLTIRVSLWRARPRMRWDQRITRRTYHHVRIGVKPHRHIRVSTTLWAGGACPEADLVGTGYYVKVRAKMAKRIKALWLKTDIFESLQPFDC